MPAPAIGAVYRLTRKGGDRGNPWVQRISCDEARCWVVGCRMVHILAAERRD